jgi:hypothetical protein
MLAGGMALVIPTVVITLSATTYRPGNEDYTPADATPADASAGGGVKVTPAAESTTTGSPSSPGAGGAGSSTTGAPGGTKHKPPKTSSLETSRSFALVSLDSSSVHLGVPDLSKHLIIVAPAVALADLKRALHRGLHEDLLRCLADQRGIATIVDPATLQP